MDLRLLPAAALTWVAAWFLTRDGVPHPKLALTSLILLVALLLLLFCTRPRHITPRNVAIGFNGQCDDEPPHKPYHSVLSHLTLAFSGVLLVTFATNYYHLQGESFLSENSGSSDQTFFIGKVISEPRKAPFGDNYNWVLQEATHGVQLNVTGPFYPFQSTVQLTGKLKASEPGQKPVAKLTGTSGVELKPPKPWWRATNVLRADLMEVTGGLSPQGRGLVPGMAIGDTSRMPPELKTAFKVSGLSHLTAVSGGHFAVILMALSYVTGALRFSRILRITAFAFIATAFVMLVRPDPAVIRAAAMCAVSIIATMRGRRAAAIPALGASILVLLALDPWLSRSYGFALSCSASASLAMFATPLAHKFTPWCGEKLAYLVAVPTVAQAGCAPILLLFTQGAATTTVLANLLVGPAVAPATLLSLAATLLAPLSPTVAALVTIPAAWSTGYIAWVATRCAALPFAMLPMPAGVVGALLLGAGFTIIGLAIWKWQPKGWPDHWRQYLSDQHKNAKLRAKAGWRRYELGIPNKQDKQLAIIGFLFALAMLFALTTFTARLVISQSGSVPTDWQIAACDVGQGDSTVIRTGPHSAILIDAGNDDGAANRCLAKLKITNIELLVISHYHSDHVGGLKSALAGRTIGSAIGPGGCGGEATAVYQVLAENGIVLQNPKAHAAGNIGNTSWQAFGHLPPDAEKQSCPLDNHAETEDAELNNQSLVFKAIIGTGPDSLSVIALGDLETQGQTELLGELRRANTPHPSIVKVAHHGSAKQSPSLVRYLSPDAAIFSAGAGNSYGHPTNKALSLYQEVGATNIRTDQCGTAIFTKQSQILTLTCFK